MVGRAPKPRLLLIILSAVTFVQCFNQEEYCNAEDELSCKKDSGINLLNVNYFCLHNNNEQMNLLSFHYVHSIDVRFRISRAVNQYVGCGNNSCDCFTSIIDDDLEMWSDGISRSSFELAKQRGVHYQVIDHKLYRQQNCLFTARWVGLHSLKL